jgi:hypothetical protein
MGLHGLLLEVYCVCVKERERGGKREVDGSERDYNGPGGGGNKKNTFSGFKVPRQCPLVPLVGVKRLIGINFYFILWRYEELRLS